MPPTEQGNEDHERQRHSHSHHVRFVVVLVMVVVCGVLSGAGRVSAATYYMCNSASSCNASSSGWGMGNDSNTTAQAQSKATPWLTLKHAFATMSGGDTLIIGSGTYTGVANEIGYNDAPNSALFPPAGSSEAWTTIQADIPGGVLFDGEQTRPMFYVWSGSWTLPHPSAYWIFSGLIWGNMPSSSTACGGAPCSAVTLVAYDHVKFLQCGAYDAAPGNTSAFAMNQNTNILLEGCYAWGHSRYKILVYGGHSNNETSSNNIVRNCVVRQDASDNNHEPLGCIAAYDSVNVLLQNNIVVDSDGTEGIQYLDNQMYTGCYQVGTTDTPADNVTFINNICLNSHIGGSNIAAGNAATDVYFRNNLFCDVQQQTATYASEIGSPGNLPSALSRAVSGWYYNNTFMNTTDLASSNTWGGGAIKYFTGDTSRGTTTLYNSIFTGITLNNTTLLAAGQQTSSYNDFYGNTNATHTPQTGDSTANPQLQWPVLSCTDNLPWSGISGSTNMCGVGQGGANMGANLIYQQGKSGTMWGDTGYNLPQDGTNGQATVLMWPVPNEAMIKARMAAYTNSTYSVNGARGFCAEGNGLYGGQITLTSYIWEYLGNPCPAEICNYSQEPDATPPSQPTGLIVN